MYCQKCQREYKDDIAKCPTCDTELVEYDSDDSKDVKVISASDKTEAGLIMDLLFNNDIPCYKKSKGPGEYMNLYMGYSVFGEDIYVAERDYQKASALLNELMAEKDTAKSPEVQN